MKKILFVIALAIFGLNTVNAQNEFKIGVNGMLPVGDADIFSSFGVSADFAYLFEVADKVWVGPELSYFHYFSKNDEGSFGDLEFELDYPDVQFLPITASGRIGLTEAFFLGADLGYAVGLNEGNDGGFFYRPKAGYSFGTVGLVLSYSGVSADGGTFNSVNLGVEFGL